MCRYLLFLLFFSISAFSQTILGKVTDENNEPLYNANVYFEGTTIHTLTDSSGNFTLNLSKKINTPLVITFMGYDAYFISDPFQNTKLQIKLNPKLNQLREIKIESQYFSREDKMKIFKQQFLGETQASKYCTIENEDDINFYYDVKSLTLNAYADKPLKIINKYLEYELEFDLIEFKIKFFKRSIKKSDVTDSFYLGTSVFKDISKFEKIKKIRDHVYYGSTKHFFKAIIDNDFNEKSFQLFKNRFQVPLNMYFITSKEDDLNKVEIRDKEGMFRVEGVEKFYSQFSLLFKKSNQSNVVFRTNTFYVDDYGNNSENDKIEFGGKISEGRIANMLPMDYLPK
ncbi:MULTISPECIES: carboxypeptidase-like regulatory domain-containing protein [Flavobacterium]|uniref:Carboxypeptidase-like regulatory domain-containing protein n=1 Tax=Flavobacterium hankyongi TaxID=1176532 RepID=A0ABP8ZWG5_9FLAO|nr:carboxypeptidase-like regulatory domain-containing protein [Flavobacterium sp. N1846]